MLSDVGTDIKLNGSRSKSGDWTGNTNETLDGDEESENLIYEYKSAYNDHLFENFYFKKYSILSFFDV